MKTIATVLAAVGAAAVFAVAALLQQLAARDVPESVSLRPRLLLTLVRRPLWLAGVGAMLVGYGLQATALAYGPVALVQPLIVTELAFALPLAMWVGHLRAGTREWLATAAIVGGIAVFVTTASPRPGTADPGVTLWVAILASSTLLMLVVALAASGPPSPRRAALLAFNAGVAFGLLAVLTKSVIHLAGHGAGTLFSHFEPYALVATGLMAFLFSQSSYQAAPITSSLPVFDVVEPIVAVLIGATALRERLALDGIDPIFVGVGAALACAGVFSLARSPVILALYERSRSSSDHGLELKVHHARH